MEDSNRDDVDTTAIVYFLIALAVGCLIVFVIVFEIYGFLERDVRSRDAAPLPIVAEAGRKTPPGPILRPSPPLDLKQFKESEMPRLTEYGWVDRPAGRVRIPVERAIDLVAERQLPSRPQPEGTRP